MTSLKHILIVEDERHLAVGIQYNLEAEGYHVTPVGDGPSALKIIEENDTDVDLVILDLMLPGMSGYAVCEEIRNMGCDVPILILSARTLSEDRTRGFDVGANQYLTKPFDLDELLSRVKNLLTHFARRHQVVRPTTKNLDQFEFGEAKINFPLCEVTIAGKSVDLTKREWELLRYFVENEGRLISKQEILENIWSMPGHIQTRAPDQFILRLRKTFERDHTHPQHFLTIRDMGYRFVAKPAPADEDAAEGDEQD